MSEEKIPSKDKTLRTPADLVAAGLLAPQRRLGIEEVAARYAIAVTSAMREIVDPSDPADPIARQFVPDERELNRLPEELSDPIGDEAHSPVEGIVHRYPDRVLLKPVHVCPVYCRFCFRREMVGPGVTPALSPKALDKALAYIAEHPEIWEVIVTGGDPFVMSDRRIAEISARLGAIGHVRIVRWHTRVPVVDPARVTPKFVRTLAAEGQKTWVALHANHPRELTPEARAACARLIEAGIAMVSQSVLLRGVNDDADTLAALMRAFVECRIKPYSLHHGDLAPGTSHFRVPIAEGQALMRALRGRVSGLAQPTYVIDLPGGAGKVPIGPNYLDDCAGSGRSEHRIEDYLGGIHVYPPT